MRYLNSICRDNFADLWQEALWHVYKYGERSRPRDQETSEVISLQLHLTNMRFNLLDHPERNLNPRFAIAEWLWIQSGRNDVLTVSRYNKNIAQFSDDGETFTGAYGPMVAGQISYMKSALQQPDSRQAVISIWRPSPGPSKDIPCTLTWQCLVRGGRLETIVSMRSSDLWLGLPYDLFNFSMMANGLAGELNCQPGSITFHLGSAHLYERNFAAVERVLSHGPGHVVRAPRLPAMAPAEVILANAASIADGNPYAGLLDVDRPWFNYQEALWQDRPNAWRILHELDQTA